ncbi:MAG: hypothetical protein GDA46_03090 [Bdellovibrionales bacterium]|nr:hypothetical protein [Bdellovibrionales bacterium]
MTVQSQAHIFNTVPKKDVFGFYNHKGKIQYKKVANLLNFNRKEISKAVRISISSVRYEENKIPNKMKEFSTAMIWLIHVTYEHLKDENKMIQWIDSPNPICGGFSPKDMICMGQYKKLVKIVSSYIEGNTP